MCSMFNVVTDEKYGVLKLRLSFNKSYSAVMTLRERPALDIDIKIRTVASVILPNTTGVGEVA